MAETPSLELEVYAGCVTVVRDGTTEIAVFPFGDDRGSAIARATLFVAADGLLDALKYGRRFLNKRDHDTDFVDAAIAKATATEGGQ